jgi:hypothetical protein
MSCIAIEATTNAFWFHDKISPYVKDVIILGFLCCFVTCVLTANPKNKAEFTVYGKIIPIGIYLSLLFLCRLNMYRPRPNDNKDNSLISAPGIVLYKPRPYAEFSEKMFIP